MPFVITITIVIISTNIITVIIIASNSQFLLYIMYYVKVVFLYNIHSSLER